MKLAWMVNGILPQIAQGQGFDATGSGTWTHKLAEIMFEDKDLEFLVFYPQHYSKTDIRGKAGRLNYYGFYEEPSAWLEYDINLEKRLKKELEQFQPDIVHIWGTEFSHSLCMLRAFGHPERTVISIQGFIYFCGEKYTEGLSDDIIYRHTFRDFLRHDSIFEQKQKFLKRGGYELEALRESRNVIGRTKWDYGTVKSVNPDLYYYHCGEILRQEFYEGDRWGYSKCEKHTLFMSQSYYPIKGIHFALKVLKSLKEKYSDVIMYVAGKNMFPANIKERIKRDSYSKYICDRIKNYGLEDSIIFTGTLDAAGMKARYLKSHVYLQASIMENSSNSLGEAMMLGVPCVASNVGGTASMLRDKKDGFLYPYDEHESAVEYICDIFEAGSDIMEKCDNAASYAASLYDVETCYNEYLRVYSELSQMV